MITLFYFVLQDDKIATAAVKFDDAKEAALAEDILQQWASRRRAAGFKCEIETVIV